MRKVFICFLIIISSLSFMGCSGEGETPVEDTVITIGVMPDFESVPFIIAEKNGYFEDEGVKVNIEHFKSAKDRDSALQSGKLDGVLTDYLAIVFSNEGGFDLKVISKTDGNIILLAGKDSGIETMADIKGKSVGLSTNTVMEYTVDSMLTATGMNPEDVDKIAIPQLPTRLEMLQGGKIDVAILPEPLAGLAVQAGAAAISSTDELNNKAIVTAFTEKSLQENPEEIKAIFRAYNTAVDYLQNEPVENYIDFLIEEQGFPPTVKDSIELPQYTYAELPDGEICMDVVQWLQGKDLIKGNYEYKDLIDDTVLR